MSQTAVVKTIGYENVAAEIVQYHHNDDPSAVEALYLPSGVDYLASGEHRTVYVDYDTDTVYKVGLNTANRNEYTILTEHVGEPGIPTVTLYEIGDVTVIAMPYLPEDGSVEHDGVCWPIDGDFNPGNVVANGGQLWLIDAGGM